jgi:hypothetical protein
VRKIVLYRFGIVAILSGGIGFMTVAADHKVLPRQHGDLEDLKGPVHALDEIHRPSDRPPSLWI